ncbi:MOSC domain-containing protein [Ferruginibacter sp. SUN106]|uniref:MOSC domain-containing protein n=1 Tax=Ferruginibacter sp. SUN106 TaxID=2978348 RepID=UPI003D368C93
MLQVSQLFIYPIKSLGGIAKPAVEITDTGFKYDRRWMLVDEQNMFLTQRTHPQMVLLYVAESLNGFTVSKYNDAGLSIHIPFLTESEKHITVTVWDDVCDAIEVSDAHNDWFSEMLNIKCKLVYMTDDTRRKVDKRYATHDEITSFSDGYPILMIGQASLDNLNEKLKEALPVNRFRPNIVFTGGHAHIEDELAAFEINALNFLGVKPCSRCVVITINQQTGKGGKEPLTTLAGYRMKNNKIYFGQNVLQQQNGIINIGDEIKIVRQQQSFI